MKTTSYNAANEIRTGIWLVVFTVSIFTAIKVEELQLNKEYTGENAGVDHTVISHNKLSSLPVLDAKLIVEPALETESRMTDNNYWGRTNAEEVVEAGLALEIESWMTDNEYWDETNSAAVVEAELVLEIKNWMMTESYWTDKQSSIFENETTKE